MKTKKENLIGISKDELKKKLVILQERVRVLRFKIEGSKSKNVKELAALKKDIARLLTQINKKRNE